MTGLVCPPWRRVLAFAFDPAYVALPRDGRTLTRKQTLQISIGGLLAVALLVVPLWGMNWHELGAAFGRAKPLYLAGLVVATVLAYVIRAWRWGYLYRPLAAVPFRDLLSATYVGFLSALAVPRSGEVLRPYLISRRHPVSTSAGLATIILERLIDLITVLLLFATYLYLLPLPEAQRRGVFLDRAKDAGLLMAGIAFAALLVLIVFHVMGEKAFVVADRMIGWLPQRIAGPLRSLLRSFHEGLAVLTAPVSLLAMIAGQSVLLWLTIAIGFYWNNLAFGIELPFHTTFLLLAFLTVGVAIPTPGSVGGFHGAYQVAMAQSFGVARETALAAAFAGHALGNLPVLVFGLIFLGREGLTMGRVTELAGADAEKPAEVQA
jgi:glycosyltransferase 2 family protein